MFGCVCIYKLTHPHPHTAHAAATHRRCRPSFSQQGQGSVYLRGKCAPVLGPDVRRRQVGTGSCPSQGWLEQARTQCTHTHTCMHACMSTTYKPACIHLKVAEELIEKSGRDMSSTPMILSGHQTPLLLQKRLPCQQHLKHPDAPLGQPNPLKQTATDR